MLNECLSFTTTIKPLSNCLANMGRGVPEIKMLMSLGGLRDRPQVLYSFGKLINRKKDLRGKFYRVSQITVPTLFCSVSKAF